MEQHGEGAHTMFDEGKREVEELQRVRVAHGAPYHHDVAIPNSNT